MPARKTGARRKRRELTDLQSMELAIGPNGPGFGCTYPGMPDSHFESEAARAAAWAEHGPDLIAGWLGEQMPGEHSTIWGQRKYDAG